MPWAEQLQAFEQPEQLISQDPSQKALEDFSRQYPTLTNLEQAHKAEESIKEQYPQNQEAVSTLSGLILQDQSQVDSIAYQQVMQNLLSKPGLADFIPKMDDGKLQSLQRVMKKQYDKLAVIEKELDIDVAEEETTKNENKTVETSIDQANNESIDWISTNLATLKEDPAISSLLQDFNLATYKQQLSEQGQQDPQKQKLLEAISVLWDEQQQIVLETVFILENIKEHADEPAYQELIASPAFENLADSFNLFAQEQGLESFEFPVSHDVPQRGFALDTISKSKSDVAKSYVGMDVEGWNVKNNVSEKASPKELSVWGAKTQTVTDENGIEQEIADPNSLTQAKQQFQGRMNDLITGHALANYQAGISNSLQGSGISKYVSLPVNDNFKIYENGVTSLPFQVGEDSFSTYMNDQWQINVPNTRVTNGGTTIKTDYKPLPLGIASLQQYEGLANNEDFTNGFLEKAKTITEQNPNKSQEELLWLMAESFEQEYNKQTSKLEDFTDPVAGEYLADSIQKFKTTRNLAEFSDNELLDQFSTWQIDSINSESPQGRAATTLMALMENSYWHELDSNDFQKLDYFMDTVNRLKTDQYVLDGKHADKALLTKFFGRKDNAMTEFEGEQQTPSITRGQETIANSFPNGIAEFMKGFASGWDDFHRFLKPRDIHRMKQWADAVNNRATKSEEWYTNLEWSHKELYADQWLDNETESVEED